MATNLSLAQLTAAYNGLVPAEKRVKKFPSKAIAEKRLAEVQPKRSKKPGTRTRDKLTVVGADEAVLDSRRVPTADTAERVQALVAKFGGKGEVTMADAAAALGVDADEIKRRVKRLRSWFGPAAVTRKGGSIIIHVTK